MRKGLIIILILIVAAAIGYNYIYQEHRDIETEQAAVISNSADIYDEFLNDPEKAQQTYLNQVVQISGTISSIDEHHLTLDQKVFCSYNDTYPELEKGEKIIVKGRVIGFDDLLNELKLDQCHFIN